MCSFVEMTINKGKPNETVVVQQVECNDPKCPAKG